MRDYRYVLLISGMCYLFTNFLFPLPTDFLWLKYISFAYMLFYAPSFILLKLGIHTKNAHTLLHKFADTVMIAYLLLALDTFTFHAWLPISGMIRYAIFDFYLFFSPIFLILGIIKGLGQDTSFKKD